MKLGTWAIREFRWLLAVLVLLAIVGFEIDDRFGTLVRPAEAGPFAAVQDLDAAMAIDRPAYASRPYVSRALMDDITSRPLFVVDRKPKATGIQSGKDGGQIGESDGLPLIELVGTLLSRRADIALLDHDLDAPRRLRVGDVVDNWEIVGIRSNSLLVEHSDVLTSIELRDASGRPLTE